MKVPILSISILMIFTALGCGDSRPRASLIFQLPAPWEFSNHQPGSEEKPFEFNQLIFRELAPESLTQLHELIPEKKGFIYLRKTFNWDSLPSNQSISLSIGRIAWADQAYINGNLIGKSGSFPPQPWSAWNRIRNYSVPSTLLKQGENELIVKIYVDHEGFVYEPGFIGTEDAIKKQIFWKNFIGNEIHILVSFLFFIISLYHALIYFKRKKDRENYYYAIFALLFAIYSSNFFSESISSLLGSEYLSYLSYQKWIILVQTGMIYYLSRFFSSFLRIPIDDKIQYGFLAFITIPAVLAAFLPNYGELHFYRGYIGLLQYIPVIVFLVYSVVRGFREKVAGSRPLAYGFIPLFLVVVHDISLVIFQIPGMIFLSGIGLPIFLAFIMFILAGKFVKVQNQTDELNATLEQKVEERTSELSHTLDEVQKLKVQQDGDYFLTSLINKPLTTNFNKSKLVSTDIYISQKKKFSFRKKSAELGGDICITGNLRFDFPGESEPRDRWVLFFNADAMGKSMQGAGGAIVAGTAMNNILTRSASNKKVLEMHPRDWVTETYQELDSIFQTFNGSMLISGVLGLLHEKSGKMYYFNAEHPWTVIYRKGKAEFLETELTLRKLGSISEFEFSVAEYRLEPGDVLFAGSDGRDDLQVEIDGNKVMNEDETLFLRLIEESNGNLETLHQLLEFQGELTDDLSLLRLGFQEDYSIAYLENQTDTLDLDSAKLAIKEGDPVRAKFILDRLLDDNKEDIPALKLLIKLLFDDKKYKDTIIRINEFHEKHPDSELFWFEKSVCHKQMQEYEQARSAGEVCRRFQPKRVANLINLSDSYRMLGSEDEARGILREAMRIEPDNESGIKLGRILATNPTGQ